MTKVVSPGATGLVLALAALTRPTVWALWLALGIDACLRRRLGAWCHATLVALACCLPWAWRNAAVLGAWIFTTTHGGYTLWLGQNPAFFADEVAGAKRVWSDESFRTWSQENDRLTLHLDEVERDRTFRRLALDWMATHPQAALASMVHHVKTMWSPLPRTPLPVVLKWGVGAYYLVLFGLVLIGTLRRGVPFVRVRPLGIVVIALTAVHAVYWSNQRMRAPLTPALAVLAATAFVPRRPSLTSSVTRS